MFVGREAEERAIERLFDEGARVVTLHGPPGIGKTALARAVTSRLQDFVFCEVSDARDLAEVCMVIAGALDVSLGGSRDPARMLAGPVSRRGALLWIDGAERVQAAVAQCIAALLDACPDARFLVTSLETLRLKDEHAFDVGPLALPDEGARLDAALASPSVQLLAAAARRGRPSFSVTEADAPAVAEIVRRLEGVPLAIEVAASRLSVMSPRDLLARMGTTLDVGTAHWTSGPERHRSLRGAFEWSWSLLDENERAALEQCTVFRGGFSLEAAERVIDAPSPAELVQALVGKSLLRTWDTGKLGLRFGMYDSVRQLCADRAGSERLAAATTRHAAYYLGLGTRWDDVWYGGVPDAPRLALERDNLLAARSVALATGGPDVLRAAIALYPVYAVMGPYAAYVDLFDDARDRAIAGTCDASLASRFYLVRGRALQLVGRREEAITSFEESLHHARKDQAALPAARALAFLGSAVRNVGRMEEARERLEASRSLFTQAGDAKSAAVVSSGLAALDLGEGKLDRARERLVAVIEAQRSLGDATTAAMVQVDLGIVLQELGDLAGAREAYDDALRVHRDSDNRRHIGITLGYLASLDYEEGALDEARVGYEGALQIMADLGDDKFGAIFRASLAAVLAALGKSDEATREIALAAEVAARQGEARVVATVDLHRARVLGDPARRGVAVGLAAQSDDVRFALRMLGYAAGPRDEPAGGGALRVDEGGDWFVPPGGERVAIARRAVHKRLLLALVRRRLSAPGEATPATELVSAGWPGERLTEDLAHNRLHVALASLRASGLRAVLLRTSAGYLLDPAIPISVERQA